MTIHEILPLLEPLKRKEKLRMIQYLLTDLYQEEVAGSPDARTEKPTSPEELGWPPNFFAETFGSLRGMNLVREPEGDYEIRDEWK
jgi:hypothetical protein